MKTKKEIIIGELRIVSESPEDAENIYRSMGCDPEITRYTGWNPYQSLQATREKIERDIHAEDGSYSWVIKKDGIFIGTIGAYDYNPEESSIEIGYSIAREFWGRGYAGMAAKAVVDFLQKEADIRIVHAWSHRDNLASRKVLKSAGFEETGTNGEEITFVKMQTSRQINHRG